MNLALWAVQVVLAILFAWQGYIKFFPPADLPEMLQWVYDIKGPLAVFIGTAELAGAAGLILPGLTRIQPWLTPLAALGLMLIMVAAAFFHLGRDEMSSIAFNVVVFILATFVAYGRWQVSRLPGRG